MIENGKISAIQMGMLMYIKTLGTAILIVPAITTKHAGRDMWVSPIWASVVGFLTVYIAYRLNKLYPNESPIQYIVHILGWIPGKFVGFIFLLFLLHTTALSVWQYAVFVQGAYYIHTPIWFIMGSIVLVCSIFVRAGIETIGRVSQQVVPILVISLLLFIILFVPELEPNRMLPIMENGILPSIKGAISPAAWFSHFILISFLLPFLADREKGMKWGFISIVAVLLNLVVINMVILFIFGDILPSLSYPVLEAARYISIFDFLEHLDSIVMAIWVGGAVVKLSLSYYILTLGTAHWLSLSSYRPIVLPLGLLIVAITIWISHDDIKLRHFFGTEEPFYILSFRLVFPLLLLLIAYIRIVGYRRREEKKG